MVNDHKNFVNSKLLKIMIGSLQPIIIVLYLIF